MADLPNRLWREWDYGGNPRCTNALGQQERQGSQDDTDLLNAAAQQPRQFVLVFRLDFDTQGVGVPYPQYALKHFELEMFFRIISSGQRPSTKAYLCGALSTSAGSNHEARAATLDLDLIKTAALEPAPQSVLRLKGLAMAIHGELLLDKMIE